MISKAKNDSKLKIITNNDEDGCELTVIMHMAVVAPWVGTVELPVAPGGGQGQGWGHH